MHTVPQATGHQLKGGIVVGGIIVSRDKLLFKTEHRLSLKSHHANQGLIQNG